MKVKICKRNSYCQVKPRKPDEANNVFIERVRKESLVQQLVKIGDDEVILGIEGPIIFDCDRGINLNLVSAEVRDGIWGKHYVLFTHNLESLIERGEIFLKLDSGCLSGVVFGDKTCDCLQQLRKAQEIIFKKGGLIVHIPNHDGRGWGEFKMANQRIMYECGLDTISTALSFYKDEDILDRRTFQEAATILRALGFPKEYKFNLGTKNNKKESALIEAGFMVSSEPVEPRGLNGKQKSNLKAKYKYWQTEKG